MDMQFYSFFVGLLILCGIQVIWAEDGAKYCPNVENKAETTFVVGESCFHYVERPDVSKLTYNFATKQCAAKGSHLMIVRDSAAQRKIYEALTMKVADSHTIFLGLQKQGATWKWVDGTVASYTNWKAGNNGTFNCGRMLLNEGGVWEEFDCALPAWYPVYVCEYNKHSTSAGNTVSSFRSVIATIMFTTLALLMS